MNLRVKSILLSGRGWPLRAVLALLAIAGGVAIWLLRTVMRVRRRPRLRLRVINSNAVTRTDVEEQGVAIARANLNGGIERRLLRSGEEKYVLCAGIRNFREPWARDFGFASLGLMAMGQQLIVREGLEMFLQYQQPSGQFPVKAHSTSILDRYLHSVLHREQPVEAPLRPKYVTAHNTLSLDGNALLVIAALNYVDGAGDHEFLQLHWPALTRAVGWIEEHFHADGLLLRQRAYADWADSIARRGRILYTNVLYWKAVHELAQAAARYGQPQDVAALTVKSIRLQQAILNHFWRDELGYLVTSRRFTNLSSDGNLLAIAWNLVTPDQANAILDNMDAYGMADPVPTQVVNESYPLSYIGIENRLAGISNYHTHAAWLWLGGWHVIALARMNRLAAAHELLYRMCRVVVNDGVVHEVYGRDGRFLSTRWYTSEAPLTWNAGMMVYAHHVLSDCQRRQPLAGSQT